MMTDSKQIWISCGYELFANHGLSGLKIETMAKKVFKSKSSFYHYFADLDVFIEALLNFHLERAAIMAQAEKNCKNIVPELINVLLEFKQDLFFNRQLRVNRSNPAFKKCFEQASGDVGYAILGIWAEELGLKEQSYLANLILKLSIENFFLQITEETMTYDWLYQYIKDLKHTVAEFKREK